MSNPNILDQPKYKMNCIIRDGYSGDLINLDSHIESVTWQTYRLASQPSSLEIVVKEGLRPSDVIINAGSFIRWGVNGQDYFYGNVEMVELLNSAQDGVIYRIKAYCHRKLLKYIMSRYRPKGMTGSDFFAQVMTAFNNQIQTMGDVGIRWAVREPSTAPLDDYYFAVSTLYSMFKDTIGAAHVAERGASQYMIRDNLGTLEWRELKALRTNYILGDGSFTDSYTYTSSIENSANIIKVYRDNPEIGKRDTWTKFNSGNVRRWRPRQMVLEAQEYMTDVEISDMIDLYLEAHDRPHRALNMSCVGINGLQAGDGVQARALRARIDHHIWCEEASHVYNSDSHMMDLKLYL